MARAQQCGIARRIERELDCLLGGGEIAAAGRRFEVADMDGNRVDRVLAMSEVPAARNGDG